MAAKPNAQFLIPGGMQAPSIQSRVLGILGTGTVLALLYFGREVLIPITLAVMLSLLVAPLIHGLRRIGLGHAASIWVVVLALVLLLSATGTVIGSQLIRIGASLPQYEETMRGKLATLDRMTLGKLGVVTGPIRRVIDHASEESETTPDAPPNVQARLAPSTQPLLVELHEPPPGPLQVLSRILASVWGPLASAGIVIVVLIFVLLEQEALRDRFIRLAGGGDLRATTIAVNDAGERLAHFFANQFAVNFSVGAIIWAGLVLLGHSQALLWATVTALLRFVPYVGVWIAAGCATLFAAAVEPGWSLSIMTVGLFVVVELVVSQFVEPFLYGHTTGLSPLSVVIAAIFWSWIWGPVGLVVSTPLTLCLVVAGRYVKALNALEILFGEVPALTLPQTFYQRVLSDDAGSVIERARTILKSKTFAAYCDSVLMPAMHLARQDLTSGSMTKAEQFRFRRAVAEVIEALSGPRKWWKRRPPISLLADVNLGRQLRDRRELLSRLQGSLDVPSGSLVLCVGVDSTFNELAAEILVRVLANGLIGSRHLLEEDLRNPALRSVNPKVPAVCLVSLEPEKERERIQSATSVFTSPVQKP
jgi:predicted PurR-regulated permease PerM